MYMSCNMNVYTPYILYFLTAKCFIKCTKQRNEFEMDSQNKNKLLLKGFWFIVLWMCVKCV